ncbi:DUF3034 family protein [Roseiterribacter gracilis]|uniref:DUF3034 family protein n=1 Tax=Roseiterribacter gracilis TaxID=2812848 RepID=UPI003B43CC65
MAADSTIAPIDRFDSGKLLATGGVSTVEGSGGGGIATWALITSYGSRDAIGANAHATYITLPDFELRSYGAAIGVFDRVELSFARQEFDTGNTGARLGLGKGFTFKQDVVGAKVRVLGDAIYEQDRWLPQISIGAQWKRNNQEAIVKAVGAKDNSGVDYYIAASKLFLDSSFLLNTTIRFTEANQMGLLGFGGNKNDGYHATFEGSLAALLSRNLAVGVELRTQNDHLQFAKQERWMDVFVAYFPTKNVSFTAAFVDLGTIALQQRQRGGYFSLQVGF